MLIDITITDWTRPLYIFVEANKTPHPHDRARADSKQGNISLVHCFPDR